MFYEKVYDVVKQIPRGKVATYGQVAKLCGNIHWCRAVGTALHKNPDPNSIPCHRVVNYRGELAKAYAFGGAIEQKRKLEMEGVCVVNDRVDLELFQYCRNH